jgi:hypothetical protein
VLCALTQVVSNSEMTPAAVRGPKAMGHQIETVSCVYSAPGCSPLSFAAPGGLHFDAPLGTLVGGNDPLIPGTVIEVGP